MPTVAKISTGASSGSALDYAKGEGVTLHHDTEQWLQEQGLKAPKQRAVAEGGTNGIDPEIAKTQFDLTKQTYDQTKRRNQVQRVTQSFSPDELDASNPADWQRANDLGVELAEKLYPQYQSAVYTHIDGEHHIVHNHIIVNKVNLVTGKKLRERPGEAVERARYYNDRIAEREGWNIVSEKGDRIRKSEKDLVADGKASWVNEIRTGINHVMADRTISSYKPFLACLSDYGVGVSRLKGNSVTFVQLDENGNQIPGHRIRGTRLGNDYDWRAIQDELENRAREQEQQREQARIEQEFEAIEERVTQGIDRERSEMAEKDCLKIPGGNRPVKQPDSNSAIRESATNLSQPRINGQKPSFTSNHRQRISAVEKQARELGQSYNQTVKRTRSIRERFDDFRKRLSNYENQFKQAISETGNRIEQKITQIRKQLHTGRPRDRYNGLSLEKEVNTHQSPTNGSGGQNKPNSSISDDEFNKAKRQFEQRFSAWRQKRDAEKQARVRQQEQQKHNNSRPTPKTPRTNTPKFIDRGGIER